jgi:adenylate cyclase
MAKRVYLLSSGASNDILMETVDTPFQELTRERERIAALARYNVLDTPHEEEYDRLVEVASYICSTPISFISLMDFDRQWFKSIKGVAVAEVDRDVALCKYLMQDEGQTMMEVCDLSQDERFRDNPQVSGELHLRFYAGTVLISRDGHRLGTLCVVDREPRQLTDVQRSCLQTLAGEVVAHLEMRRQRELLQKLNGDLFQEVERKIAEQDKVLRLFSKFVPEEVVRVLYTQGPGAHDARLVYVTVLFCDIRNYTGMAENLTPQQAVDLLRTYYSVMTDVIKRHHGTVIQYVGDEIFAVFGAPVTHHTHELNAVRCARQMIRQLAEYNQALHLPLPAPLSVGIGLNAGPVVAGTLGSAEKLEYSITGDTVNTGKRIECQTKGHPNAILISQSVFDKVQAAVTVRPWAPVYVKGKAQPLPLYQVLGLRS